MYLIKDFTGPASKILYGKKGDQIEVLSERADMYLATNGNHLFYIRKDKVTEAFVEKEPEKKK